MQSLSRTAQLSAAELIDFVCRSEADTEGAQKWAAGLAHALAGQEDGMGYVRTCRARSAAAPAWASVLLVVFRRQCLSAPTMGRLLSICRGCVAKLRRPAPSACLLRALARRRAKSAMSYRMLEQREQMGGGAGAHRALDSWRGQRKGVMHNSTVGLLILCWVTRLVSQMARGRQIDMYSPMLGYASSAGAPLGAVAQCRGTDVLQGSGLLDMELIGPCNRSVTAL